jgi:L-amino acid N-acyltransferase YncA
MIRKATDKDAASIASIYNYYIEKTAVTFEENAIDEMEVVKRLNLAQELDWWVYDHQDQIKAYAYASYWKPRSAYRYTLETSVYVHP